VDVGEWIESAGEKRGGGKKPYIIQADFLAKGAIVQIKPILKPGIGLELDTLISWHRLCGRGKQARM
jgi:hypothetical protein